MIPPFKYCNMLKPSPMEKIVMKALKKEDISFYREVSFEKCINPLTGMPLRYDFYLPVKNVLLEYDGKGAHKGAKVKARDLIKTNFAKSNNVALIRLKGTEAIRQFIKYYLSNSYLESLTFNTRNDTFKVKKEKKVYEPFVDPVEIIIRNAKPGEYTEENCPF